MIPKGVWNTIDTTTATENFVMRSVCIEGLKSKVISSSEVKINSAFSFG